MAFDFPASPTTGQVFTVGNATYTYNGYAWMGGAQLVAPSIVSDTPPANPLQGQLWWESDSGMLFTNYNDGNTTQWVQINALQANAVLKTGDTMSGNLVIAKAAAYLQLDAPVAPAVAQVVHSVAGKSRWAVGTDGTNETGSNVGSNYIIGRFNDAGAYIDAPITVNRSTGVTYLINTTASSLGTNGALVVTGGVGVGGMVNINGTQAARLNIAANATMPAAGCALRIGFVGAALEFALGFRPAQDNCTPLYFYNASGTAVGSVTNSTTATAFNTASSAELKEDLQSFDAGNIIDKTEIYDFKWKGLDERAYGVVAQEAVEVYPTAVVHVEHQDEDFWGVDYSKYVPVILQELKALRARVAELEGKGA
jgi:hypothetical protein